MRLTKPCENCGKRIVKSPNCSTTAWPLRKYCSQSCHYADRKNHPSPLTGKTRPELKAKNLQKRKFRKCCICGEPTKYVVPHVKKKRIPVRCDNQTCIKVVRDRKNEHIRKTHLRMYRLGQRTPVKNPWKGVPRISAEEVAMTDWFNAHKWVGQFHVKTGFSWKDHMPSVFILDFAKPRKKLYIEIDGSVHRLKKDKDERRDKILANLGWRGLRVPASLVRSDIKQVKAIITGFNSSDAA